MSREDVLERLRILDPDQRFDDEDDAYDAQVLMHRVLARPQTKRRRLRPQAVLRIAAIVGAALAVVLVVPALAVGTSPFQLLGRQADPVLPVNGLLAAKGAGALYVIDPRSGGMLRLKGTADMDHPSWSPDARLLAVDRTEKGSTSVYTVWPNGTHAQLILKDASLPAWSDDGTRIFVQRDTCTAPGGCDATDEDTIQVYSVAIDGTDAHPVSEGDYNVSEPGWPPGQNVLAFLGDESRSVNDAQTGPTELNSLDATWSPDETQLAVAGTPSGLWVIDSDGRPQLLSKGAFSSLSWGVEVKQPAERSVRR